MGCPEGSVILRSLLQMRKEHNLKSWMVFADLIKAFDSVDHKLLFVLLKKLVSQVVLFKRLRIYTRILR